LLLFYSLRPRHHLHSFPTRRSSDLFNGHFHGFTESKAGSTILTTNRCCAISRKNHDGTKEKGYFLCAAKEGRIERKFIEVKPDGDRKSTRLNSSHDQISYAVFCLKK